MSEHHPMSEGRTQFGLDLEEALGEVLAHMRGEIHLPSVESTGAQPAAFRSVREATGLSRPAFAKRFGLNTRTVQEWEQGRRKPDPAMAVLYRVIAREPDAVVRALKAP